MTQTLTRVAVLLGGLAIVASTACSPAPVLCVEGDEETCDGGSLPLDGCNSPEAAKSDPACTLTLCQDLEAFISTVEDGGIDVDFYSVTMPAGLTARSLLTVKAGYGGVPQTAVNFSVNVLREQGDGGLGAIASGNDRRMGAAVPKNVEITQPFSESSAQLIIRVSDVGGVALPRVDNKNPYKLNVCVIDNPDVNEPNDVTPTAIALTAANGVQQGTSSGYLATNDDVDRFSFPVSGAREIIYLRVSSTMMNLMPPLPYRMAYTLKDPMGRPISEGVMDNEFLQINLSTARLTAGDGTYTLEVFGFKTAQQMTPALGDLRLKYDVEVRLMPDLDMSEGMGGNDTSATARPVNLALNTTTALTGRIAYVPDTEWFRLNLPARAGPTVLRYELMPAGAGGRYPPLSMIPTRQIRVIQEVTTGATIQDRQTACVSNRQVCPRSFDDPNAGTGLLVTGVCRSPGIDPPHCVLSERNEEYQIAPLRNQKNFVGGIPVPANVSAILFSFGDTGRGRLKYADDRDWSIRVTLEDDPDEAMRPPGDQPIDVTFGGAPSIVRGVISHGYGKTRDFRDLNTGPGIRGPNDYDATETDRDAYRFNYGGVMGDQTWQLDWTVGDVDGGSGPAGTLAFELLLCTGAPLADGGCTGVQTNLSPTFGDFTPWYLPMLPQNRRVHFRQTRSGNQTTVTLQPESCFCFSQDKVASGSFQMRVVAVDRISNEPIPYMVRQSISAYPGSIQNPDGGAAVSCPGRGADGGGGCGFLVRE
ncbi:MAG: hypothetical protein Q8S33_05815 [Myxococcales bacterium]|nr:hypothetical protein [Myxococcales bacterium]